MPTLACPACRTKLTAPAEVLGESVRCTQCGKSFRASPAQSPYLEGLPPPPPDRRPWILAGATAAALLLVIGLIVGLDALEDEQRRIRSSGGVMPTPTPSLASEEKPKFYTADGIPIEPVGEADRQPLPGDDLPPILKKVIEKEQATKPKPKPPMGEVTLSDVRWSVAPGVRALEIGYRFHNGVPQPRLYVLMARLNDGVVQTIPLDEVDSAEGVLTLSLPAMLDGGRLPKVEVWIERNLGAGVMQKVSNSATAD